MASLAHAGRASAFTQPTARRALKAKAAHIIGPMPAPPDSHRRAVESGTGVLLCQLRRNPRISSSPSRHGGRCASSSRSAAGGISGGGGARG
eukprot:7934573-Pyramimonas_sp.AAC.1